MIFINQSLSGSKKSEVYKVKKTFKQIFKIGLCLGLVLITVCGVRFYLTCSVITQWIADENVVYVPRKPATRFDHEYLLSFLGMESHDFWKIKLKAKDIENLQHEIESGNWEKLDNDHIEILANNTYLEDYGVYSEMADSENVYVCIYDSRNGEIVKDTSFRSSEILVFIYDSDDSIYFCNFLNW